MVGRRPVGVFEGIIGQGNEKVRAIVDPEARGGTGARFHDLEADLLVDRPARIGVADALPAHRFGGIIPAASVFFRQIDVDHRPAERIDLRFPARGKEVGARGPAEPVEFRPFSGNWLIPPRPNVPIAIGTGRVVITEIMEIKMATRACFRQILEITRHFFARMAVLIARGRRRRTSRGGGRRSASR